MANKHLKCEAHTLDDRSWWYEEQQGIHVVQEYRNRADDYVATVMTLIPWNDVRSALKRKDKR
jgi:hypothetical protein